MLRGSSPAAAVALALPQIPPGDMKKMHNMLPFRGFCFRAAVLALAMTAQVDGLVQQYCSSQNTGSSFGVVTNIYQSNGACHDTCSAEYAFAVVQYQSCWCTNIAPGTTTSVGNCNEDCPGYPAEKCGNSDSGLFGYIALNNSPSGTAGGSSSSTPPPTSTRQSTPTTAPPPSTQEPETSYTSSQSSTTPSSPSSSTTESTTESTVEPVTSVIMTTISGAVVTQTVTSTPLPAPQSNESAQQPLDRHDGMSGGAIAGVVIGVLAALAAIAAAAFLLWRRRKASEQSEAGGPPTSAGSSRLGRNVSVLSKAGLLTGTRPSMGEARDDYYASQPAGQTSVRHSMMFGSGMAHGVDPASPLGSSHGSDQTRRMSKPMVYDQRLNPSALFANAEANGSRISMQDQQDYSRPLGVMNPDPRPSFESRISKA